jgi:hypothetical protein
MLLVSLAISATGHLLEVLRQPLGFSPDNVLTLFAVPSRLQGQPDAFYAEAVRTLADRADVVSAGAVEALPLSGIVPRDKVTAPGATAIPLVRILPGYFEAAGIRLLQGRLFDATADIVSSPAIVSESAASILFPGRDPIGQQLESQQAGSFTIVGVVGDVRMSPARPRDALAYAIVHPTFDGIMQLVARLRQRSPQAAFEIRQLVGSLDRDMPVTTRWWSESIKSMPEYRVPRLQTIVLGTVAALATTLAAAGLFGVVSYNTRRRMPELAIRLALGAKPDSLARKLALRMAPPVSIGLVIGLITTWFLGRVLTANLVGFRAWEWPVLAGGAAIIASTAVLSTYLPVRKASRRLPVMTVLKSP